MNLKELKIEKMQASDISEIASLEKECFSLPWSEKSLADELENPVARFFSAKYKNELAGYIGAFNVAGEVSITNVAVKEKFRKQGIGASLLKKLEETARLENAEFITLEVRASNENAIRLYIQSGYEKAGLRNDFYSNPKEDAILMTKNLH
jgi:ribosomal-protein-alanine N-acetyltransferase